MIGKTYKTKNYGNVKVIKEANRKGYFVVEFLATGNTDMFRKDAIKNGEIRDKYSTTLCGVGIIGNVKTRGKNKKLYNVWRNMIVRCYDGKNNAYYNKVKVCDDWKLFEKFVNDHTLIDGWDKNLYNLGLLEIDKDIKQRRSAEKIYSKENCMWVLKEVNSRIQDAQQKIFTAISPEGVEYRSSNISKFAREHGFERRQISAVLNGRFKTSLGWKFSFIDEEIV